MAQGRWTVTFGEDKKGVCRIGPLTLRVERIPDEWHIAATRHDGPPSATEDDTLSAESAGDLDWRRWVVSGSDLDIVLSAATPDRSVVVRPDYQVIIPPGQKATFYVTIPVWVRITAGSDKTLLCEEPPVTLSKIWFGDFLSGEVCYSLKTRARRSFDRDTTDDYRAICPVSVTNRADTDLPLERICIRTAHLTLFEDDGLLWASEVTAVFQGDEHVAKLTYGEKPPPECDRATQVFEPRQPAQGSVLRRTFQKMKWLNIP